MIRKYEDKDFPLFRDALLKYGIKSNHKKLYEHLEPGDEEVYARYIAGLELDKYIIDETYFAMVQKNYQWYDPAEIYLDVVMMLKIGSTANFKSLTDGLNSIAKTISYINYINICFT